VVVALPAFEETATVVVVASSTTEVLSSAAVVVPVARVLVSITFEEISICVDCFVLEVAASVVMVVVVLVSATFISVVVGSSPSVEVVSNTIVPEPVECGAEMEYVDSETTDKRLEPVTYQYWIPNLLEFEAIPSGLALLQ
jgi:hypothetical protein